MSLDPSCGMIEVRAHGYKFNNDSYIGGDMNVSPFDFNYANVIDDTNETGVSSTSYLATGDCLSWTRVDQTYLNYTNGRFVPCDLRGKLPFFSGNSCIAKSVDDNGNSFLGYIIYGSPYYIQKLGPTPTKVYFGQNIKIEILTAG